MRSDILPGRKLSQSIQILKARAPIQTQTAIQTGTASRAAPAAIKKPTTNIATNQTIPRYGNPARTKPNPGTSRLSSTPGQRRLEVAGRSSLIC